MNPGLFIDTDLDFTKVAVSEVRISDNADTWPQELLQELLKQHPYLGQYDTSPVMSEVDGERGFGLGYFTVSSKSARTAVGPGGRAMQQLEGVKSIRVPIIVSENSAKPFDVFIGPDGTAQPLSDERTREALYRPNMFDTTGKSPSTDWISDSLYPPSSSGRTLHGGQVMEMPKTSSAKFILPTIVSTILQDDIDRVEDEISKTANLAPALIQNEATFPFIDLLSKAQPTTSHDVAKVASRHIPYDVVQVVREGERYLLKAANSQMFAPEELEADRHTMAQEAGEDLVEEADESGAALLSTNPVVHNNVEDDEVSVATQFGEYRVKDATTGKEYMGWVFPKVLDYDGTELPMAVFTNGAISAIQPEIAGSFVAKSANIIRANPDGHGFFYRVTASGSVVAFLPSECKGSFADPKGQGYMVESLGGEQQIVRPTRGFTGVQAIGPNEYAIPGDVKWAPLGDEAVALLESPDEFAKTAALAHAATTVRIISDGTCWSFKEGPGLAKLASHQREGLDGAEAHFLACTFGMEKNFALDQLVKAARHGEAYVRGCRPIHTPADRMVELRKLAQQEWDQLPPRHLLLKEASTLSDVSTVDKVLSVGFINPENVGVFINYLPDLQHCVSKLAEMLIAVRMGMKDVPESAVKSAMERMDEVVNGLRKLVYRQSTLEQ